MAVNSLTPNLMVEDVEATVEWYERVFDAKRVATLPADAETGYFWAQVMVEQSPLMFQERANLEEKLPDLEGTDVGGSTVFYVDVNDAQQMHDRLETAGVDIIKGITETDFGWRQFAATDCNGYILWFGEKMEEEAAEDIGRTQRLYRAHVADQGPNKPGQRQHAAPEDASKHWG